MSADGSRSPGAEPGDEDTDLAARRRGLVIVAHPDDETLWAGGLLLLRDEWDWTVIALCRGHDRDRRPRFFRALERLGARGRISDLDDSPDQPPLSDHHVRAVLLEELDDLAYDLLLTHSPAGEYTRHLRHEEVARAVLGLWREGAIDAGELWCFAYQDDGGASLPTPIGDASMKLRLTDRVWSRKRDIVEQVYGFGPGSWEHDTTPREEAFWRFDSPSGLAGWQRDGRVS